ncbi:hypothetical protein niasHT_038900 [Heterodera trifolii]|uniref:Uncharacterized protein n=1 Tax=Heterodera trifolii TaxID=157864 RepID=A0ABD2J3Z5_9BILA
MNLANNVHKFAEFMDELYTNYRDEHDKMDTILIDPPKPYPQNNYSEKQKRTVFNLTFVKCAAEIAHFRVMNKDEDSKDAYEILKMGPRYKTRDAIIEFVGFVHFDQSLGHKINEKFKNEFFNPKEEIAKSVVNQIMQLTFSFAVRVILCIM